MFEQFYKEPDVVYHYTKRENVDKIKRERQLKKFKDNYVFVCESYEDCIDIIKNTILNPNAAYLDFDGVIKSYKDVSINDYVILKLKPRYSKITSWFKSNSAIGVKSETNKADIVNRGLAYKGNLNIEVLEVMEIKDL